VIEGMAGETQSPSSPLNRQRAMMVLEEEERIVKQRMNAVRELVRLKNEEARILEAKRQLGIAVR
jgi:predicted ATPase